MIRQQIHSRKPQTEGFSHYHFNKAFLGCTGVEPQTRTCYVTDPESLEMKKIVMRNAERSYLLIDAKKLER